MITTASDGRSLSGHLRRYIKGSVKMVCELCERDVERVATHHLIVKLKGGKNGPQARLCPTCHRQVHALFGDGTLVKRINNVEALKAEPQVVSYLSCVQKQMGSANFRVRRRRGRC